MARDNRRLSAVRCLALVRYSSKVYTCMVWLVGEVDVAGLGEMRDKSTYLHDV